jgi:hypothetical protein
MAKRKSKEGSLAGYFKGVFQSNPQWLHERSNDAVLARYRKDHGLAPDAPVENKVRQNLANLKSVLRKKARKRRGRPPKSASSVPVAKPVAAMKRGPANRLEVLEEMIDDCLTAAKHHDQEGLHDVIQMLRRARNAVVWKLGE